MSAIERIVEEAVAEEAGPNAAIDIGLIITIVTQLLGFIQNCRGNARKAIKDGDTEAKVAAFRAVVASGYEGHRGNLMTKLVDKGKNATDEDIEETFSIARSLPSLEYFPTVGTLLIVAAMIFGCTQTTMAGPLSGAIDIASTWTVTEVKSETLPKGWVENKVPAATRMEYRPSGYSRPWTETSGTTSWSHLLSHGYNPDILRNTPQQYWNYLHGDAHEGRRSRIVNVQQPVRQIISYQKPAKTYCPNG